METDQSGAPHVTIDWEAARVFLARVVSGRLHRGDADTVEDLTQEALVRLLRALRRAPAENQEALMTAIAQRTVIDHLRARGRWDPVVGPMTDAVEETAATAAPAPDALGDPVARSRFVVLEYFQRARSDCLQLANHFYAETEWSQVAERLGKSHAAVRKQWSRCLETLREAVEKEPTLSVLTEWAEEL